MLFYNPNREYNDSVFCEYCGVSCVTEYDSVPYGSTSVWTSSTYCDNQACLGEKEPECEVCHIKEWQYVDPLTQVTEEDGCQFYFCNECFENTYALEGVAVA